MTPQKYSFFFPFQWRVEFDFFMDYLGILMQLLEIHFQRFKQENSEAYWGNYMKWEIICTDISSDILLSPGYGHISRLLYSLLAFLLCLTEQGSRMDKYGNVALLWLCSCGLNKIFTIRQAMEKTWGIVKYPSLEIFKIWLENESGDLQRPFHHKLFRGSMNFGLDRKSVV